MMPPSLNPRLVFFIALICLGQLLGRAQTGAEEQKPKNTKAAPAAAAQKNFEKMQIPEVTKAGLGKLAPWITAPMMSRSVWGVDQMKGNITVLEWVNFDCPYVKKFYDSGIMQGYQENYTARGVRWYLVASSGRKKPGFLTTESAKQIIGEKKAKPTDVVLDEAGFAAQLYQVTKTPHLVIIDHDGIVRYSGAVDDLPTSDAADTSHAKPMLRFALEAVFNTKKPPIVQAPVYGCELSHAE